MTLGRKLVMLININLSHVPQFLSHSYLPPKSNSSNEDRTLLERNFQRKDVGEAGTGPSMLLHYIPLPRLIGVKVMLSNFLVPTLALFLKKVTEISKLYF
jgi:hypothetical protein